MAIDITSHWVEKYVNKTIIVINIISFKVGGVIEFNLTSVDFFWLILALIIVIQYL